MKSIAILLLAAVPIGASFRSPEPVPATSSVEWNSREEMAKQVATAWASSLFRGEVAVTAALSDVPFAMDRKMTIDSMSELNKVFGEVLGSKGKRDLTITDVKVTKTSDAILNNVYPASYIVVELKVDGEGVQLCVKPGDAFRVVGLSD